MFKAIDVNATKRYTSPNDPDQAKPTVFIVGAIDTTLRSYIDGKCTRISVNQKTNNRDVHIDPMEYNRLVFKYGLKDIENFFASDGTTPMELGRGTTSIAGTPYQCLTDECVKNFHPDLISEVAEQIVKFQGLTAEETKN